MRAGHGLALSLVLAMVACSPVTFPAGPPMTPPALDDGAPATSPAEAAAAQADQPASASMTMADGTRLPLRQWAPDGPPRAVLLALHGMNDYSNFFQSAGHALARRGIWSFAYDQRGFGRAPHAGYWSSTQAMVEDARTAIELLAANHPDLPVYLLGESMGGAVALLAATRPPPALRGVILSAPAVWGRQSMPWWQRTLLWLAYQLAPGWAPSGRGLNIQPSDNIAMLRALSADPLVIKRTRIDAIHGVVDLMDSAQAAPAQVRRPVLLLYGEKDQIIPAAPVWAMAESLPCRRAALYPEGWHMLLRDLQAQVVLDDIAAWIDDATQPLPSGAEARHPLAPPAGDSAPQPEAMSCAP